MLTAVPATTSNGGSHSATGLLVVGIAFIVIGGLQLLKPDLSYRLSRWQYKNKNALQPSNAALLVARVAGGIAVIVGIVLIVVAANK